MPGLNLLIISPNFSGLMRLSLERSGDGDFSAQIYFLFSSSNLKPTATVPFFFSGDFFMDIVCFCDSTSTTKIFLNNLLSCSFIGVDSVVIYDGLTSVFSNRSRAFCLRS